MKGHYLHCCGFHRTLIALAVVMSLVSAAPTNEKQISSTSGDLMVPLGSSGLGFLPPVGWRSKSCSDKNQVLLMVSANQKDTLHVYNFGTMSAKAPPELVLKKMAEGFTKAMGADASQWNLTESREIKLVSRHALLNQYRGVIEKEPKHIMVLTMIHDETVWVVYSTSELKSAKTLHECLLGIVTAPSVGATSPPKELFTTEIMDDVDYYMLSEEKSYLNDLDAVQREVIRRTYSPAK